MTCPCPGLSAYHLLTIPAGEAPLLHSSPRLPALGQRALAACSTLVAEYLIKMESLLTQEPGDKTKGPFIGTGSVASVASAMALLTSLWFQTPDRLLLWFSISRIYSPLLAPAQPMTTLLTPAWMKGH